MTTFDRDATIYRTAREVFDEEEPSEGNFDAIYLALPLIAADVLAPLKTLHQRVGLHNPADECCCPDRDVHEIGYDEDGEPACLTEDPICWICAECYHDDPGLDPAEWPCPTAQAIADIEAKAGVK